MPTLVEMTGSQWQRGVGWIRDRPLLADGLLAAVLFFAAVMAGVTADIEGTEREWDAAGAMVAAGMVLPLTVRRIQPVAVFYVVALLTASYWVADYPDGPEVRIDDEILEIESTDLTLLPQVLTMGAEDADASSWAGGVLVHDSVADQPGRAVGEVLTIEAGNGMTIDAEIVGVFAEQLIVESDYLLDSRAFAELGSADDLSFILLDAAEGVSALEVEAALAELRIEHPQLAIDSAVSFRETAEATIDSALVVVNALLALALIIALLGIANTLALAIHERTRELGMMRAVGMTRRQVRRMVRWEAVLIATFGAVAGAVLGVGFSWVIVQAVPESITSTWSIPVARVVLVALIASAAGLMAAIVPARRAGRLDVLAAIRQ